MSVEELLKPRYKVIADYPNMKLWKVGNIIYECISADEKKEKYFTTGHGDIAFFDLTKYPHLFRKLEWWEERDEKDMPRYVKDKSAIPATIRKIQNQFSFYYPHGFNHPESKILDDIGSFISDNRNYKYWAHLPATEQEYLNYINIVK